MKQKLAIALLLLLPIPPEIGPDEHSTRISGYLSQYGKQPSEATLQYRVEVGDIPNPIYYDAFIAVADCGQIGKEGWLSVDDGDWLRTIVFDCAGHVETVKWMDENNIIGEIDYQTAQRLDIVGRGNVPATLIWSE